MSEENPEVTEETEETAVEETDDLDALLAEYDDEPEETAAALPEEPSEIEILKRELEETKGYIQNLRQRDEQTDLARAVTRLREASGGTLDVLSDKFLEGRLRLEAGEDPRLVKAFENRAKDPEKFDAVLASFAKKVKGELKTPDPQLSKDREAMDTYVRSQTNQSGNEHQPDVRGMSSSDFNQHWNTLMKEAKLSRNGIQH